MPSVRNLTTEEKNLQDRYQSVQVIKKQLEQAQHNLSAQRKRKSELSEKLKMEDCVEQFASMQQKLVDMKNEARLLQEYLVLNKNNKNSFKKGNK